MLDALEYLHDKAGVVHRDLKLENILIDSSVTFKLIDFGLSDSGNLKCLRGAVGSPSYVAPEVLEKSTYDGSKVDIFSMGVLLFIIVQGQFPHGTKILKDKYYDMIKNRQYDAYFKAVDSTDVSDEFKDLIVRLLDYVPSKRPTTAQIRQHAFLQNADYSHEETRASLRREIRAVLASKQKPSSSNNVTAATEQAQYATTECCDMGATDENE